MRWSIRFLVLSAILASMLSPNVAYSFQPRPVSTHGEYVHSASQMRFPESIEGFVRVAVTDYSADESDIGVGYNLNDASRPAAVTVYVYPAGEVTSFGSPPEIIATALAGLDSQHFRAIQNDIVTAHPGAILLIEDRFSLQNSIESPQAYRAKYKYMDAFAGMRRQVVSDAYLIRRGNWWITFRISMPAEQEAQARQAVEAFINALQLPPSNS